MDETLQKTVEVLYFEGCPHHRETVARVREVGHELGLHAAVREVEVRTLEDAARLGFLGSPSVRIDGVDIEPAARASTAYGFACRTYDGSGVPPRELVIAALVASRGAAGASGTARRGWRRSLASIAGAAALLLPVGTCPACFPAYAAILSATGLPFLLNERYLLAIVAALLTAALAGLGYQAQSRRGYGPLVVGSLGAALALTGKFALASGPMLYVGISVLMSATVWNAWPLHDASLPSCAQCAPQAGKAGQPERTKE